MPENKDYKKVVLNYLIAHQNEEVLRTSIIHEIGISKSRLSEILKSIQSDGYIIESPPRKGIVKLVTIANDKIMSPINDPELRMWLILFILSKYKKLSLEDLLRKILILKDTAYAEIDMLRQATSTHHHDNANLIKAMRNNSPQIFGSESLSVAKDILSVTTVRTDLNRMRSLHYVSMHKAEQTTYQLTSSAPIIAISSADKLFELWRDNIDYKAVSSTFSPIKDVCKKIELICDINPDQNINTAFGKTHNLTPEQVSSFEKLSNIDYKSYAVLIKRKTSHGVIEKHFMVGLVYFSAETNAFYLLGKNIDKNRIEIERLDRVKTILQDAGDNTEYHSNEYFKIYTEIFSATYEPVVYKVKVLYQGLKNVKNRFESLHSMRSNSTIRAINNPPSDCKYSFVYEDNIRGLSDFARYLRSFGYSALALEPAELAQKMENTYSLVIKKNGEI